MATLPSQHRDWEEVFNTWASAPSLTAQEKCDNAERIVKKAITSNAKLSGLDIEVFVQGSYANRTNVRQDSDVDICVLYKAAFFSDYTLTPGLNDQVLRFVDSKYSYANFKNDVDVALKSYFGDAYTRGKKAFDVHANTYRVDADVVPCFEERRYFGTPGNYLYASGSKLIPDGGGPIANWPKQNYTNGVAKNDATSSRFKPIVRLFKSLRNEMASNGHPEALSVPSFLVECLIWNVPNEKFEGTSYWDIVKAIILRLWNGTLKDETCLNWLEVNRFKKVFQGGQPWDRQQVNSFFNAAWFYIGYK